jgi:hypothetical protein
LSPREQPYVLRGTIEVLRCYVNHYFQPFPPVDNRLLRSMWIGTGAKPSRIHTTAASSGVILVGGFQIFDWSRAGHSRLVAMNAAQSGSEKGRAEVFYRSEDSRMIPDLSTTNVSHMLIDRALALRNGPLRNLRYPRQNELSAELIEPRCKATGGVDMDLGSNQN